jgi:hypothetical protein
MMVCLLLLLSLTAGVLAVPARPSMNALDWTSDYDAAVEAARAAGLPLLIVLEDGRQAASPLFSLNSPAALRVLSRYRLCRLNVKSELGRRIATGYNATQFPYTLITDADCERIVFRGAGSFSQGSWERTLANFAGPDASTDRAAAKSPAARPQPGDQELDHHEFDAAEAAFGHVDLQQAVTAAERRQRPLLAYITMEGCHYCERMRQHTLQEDSVLTAVAHSFESVIVHREQDGAWIDQFDVRIYPTTLLIGRDGSVVDRLEGYVEPAEFLSRLRRNRLPTISSLW